MQDSSFLRDAIYVEQELRRSLTTLEAKNTKTTGVDAWGAKRALRYVIEIYRARGLANDPAVSALQADVWDIGEKQPRQKTIAALRRGLDAVAALRTSVPEQRITELQNEVKRLQSQIQGLTAPSASDGAAADGAEDKKAIDLSADSTVFVIMPFKENFKDVWEGGILRASKAKGFKAVRVDSINRSSNITDDIIRSIEDCKLAIVDVTGNNPNVMFELGYTLAKEKPHIIISQSTEFLPFDIRQIRTIVYTNTWSGIEELNARIQDFLSDYKNPKPKGSAKGKSKKASSAKKDGKGAGGKKASEE